MTPGLKQTNGLWTGSLIADSLSGTSLTIYASGLNVGASISGTSNVYSANSYVTQSVNFTGGSPYGVGLTQTFTARSIISGGMWVTMSGGLALAGPASSVAPIGVSLPGVTAQSGGTVIVIMQGIVPMISEGTIAAANGCQPGAGAGLNTVAPHVAGSALFYPTLDAAASGTSTVVFVALL